MEKKILTKADIKKYIIEYHDKVKSLIDIENQTELLYLENKLSKNYDKSKTEQSYIYNNLKEQIDEIKKNYLLQISFSFCLIVSYLVYKMIKVRRI